MSVDRRIGVGAGALAALALVLATVMAGVLAPARPGASSAPGADSPAAELVVLLEQGEQASWVVTFDFRRIVDGATVARAAHTEARTPDVQVSVTPATLTAHRAGAAYACVRADRARPPECTRRDATARLGTAAVVATAVDAGAYTVERLAAAEIAGERARCYAVVATGGYLPALGVETHHCLAADGVPLRTRIGRPTHIDERTARRVERAPRAADIEGLISGFGR